MKVTKESCYEHKILKSHRLYFSFSKDLVTYVDPEWRDLRST